MSPTKSSLIVFALSSVVLVGGCQKETASTSPANMNDVELVPNLDAKPGDTTTCPFSGRSFVVKTEHPRVEYQGENYWICSEKAADAVREDPSAYLDDFSG